MKAIIQRRFEDNIARVSNLTELYRDSLMGAGPGRRGHSKTDVLRAAVVMLHAAMEDLLRSIAYWKLPTANEETLARIPLDSVAPATKFHLGALSAYRGRSVSEVIQVSVNAYLERSNYNNVDEIAAFLQSVNIDVDVIRPHFVLIEPVMNRRHQIVHRADQDDSATGSGHHRVTSIGHGTVVAWIQQISDFGRAVLDQV